MERSQSFDVERWTHYHEDGFIILCDCYYIFHKDELDLCTEQFVEYNALHIIIDNFLID